MLKNLLRSAIHRTATRPGPAARILLGAALAATTIVCRPADKKAPANAVSAADTAGTAASTATAATGRAVGDPYLVTFRINGSPTEIGAIQFEVRPKSDKGGFATDSGKAECDSLIGEALSAFSTHADGKLVGALVDVGGFAAPATVARCTYLSPQAVSADAFTVTVTDASDVQAVALAPTPSLVISEVKRVE